MVKKINLKRRIDDLLVSFTPEELAQQLEESCLEHQDMSIVGVMYFVAAWEFKKIHDYLHKQYPTPGGILNDNN